MKANLVLDDGTVLPGISFGCNRGVAGEVVFLTAMTGYVEALTDPSYAGQILVFTYPLIGNYGVAKESYQSSKIQAAGVIISEHCLNPSHYSSQKNFASWLAEYNVPGLNGLDTRALTQKIRDSGTMLGKIELTDKLEFEDPNDKNLVSEVSCRQPIEFKSCRGAKTVLIIDCGCKKAIIEALRLRGVNVIVAPWDFDPWKEEMRFDGLLISNGPGDPKKAGKTIETAKKAIRKEIPILGICLGNQILALAAGGETYKLKFGRRSLNQPVKDIFNGHCYVTSQNHGFAVKNIPSGWKRRFINLNDGTNEGIVSDQGRFVGVQFHPEGHPGPEDTAFVFDEFISQL